MDDVCKTRGKRRAIYIEQDRLPTANLTDLLFYHARIGSCLQARINAMRSLVRRNTKLHLHQK